MSKLLVVVFIVFPFCYLKAQVKLPDIPVSVFSNGKSFYKIIEELTDTYHLPFYFSSSKIKTQTPLYIQVEKMPLTEFLELVKKQVEFDYRITETQIILYLGLTDKETSKIKSVRGFIQDANTGERLIGANIIFPEIARGTTTNAFGYFTYSLPPAQYHLLCSNIGYTSLDTVIDITGDVQVEIKMKPSTITLKEVNLVNKVNDKVTSIQTGYDEVPMKMLRIFPTLMGEKDALQFMKLLPGIRSCNEGSNGLYIRGATPTQTTFLVDDAPMYNMYHISGLFSTVNPDAIKDLRVYKSNIPAKTGGALSSIVDIRLRDGSNQNYIVTGGIGTVSSRVTVEGPIVKNKASFIVSARRSYIDEFLSLFNGLQDVTFYFYDIHSKLNYTLNSRNRIYVSGYAGKDFFDSEGGITWGNSLMSMRWNKVFNRGLFSNLTFTGSKYVHSFISADTDRGLRISTVLNNYALKYDLVYTSPSNLKINFGAGSCFAVMHPAEISSDNALSIPNLEMAKTQRRLIHHVYGDLDFFPGTNWGINAGLRVSALQNISAPEENIMLKPEPTLSVKYQVSPKSSLKAAFSRNFQFYHGATIYDMLIPFERFIYADSKLPAQYADHVTTGYFFKPKDDLFELSLELYYSWMHNQSRFKLENEVILDNNYHALAVLGEVEAYGLEFSLRKQLGRFTGLLSYTLSKVDKEEFLENYSYAYNPFYDRRHDGSFSLGVEASRRVILSGTWAIMSGNPFNYPVGKYEIRGRTVALYSSDKLYNKRMPLYHRLDVGCQIKLGKGEGKFSHSLSFNVYNIYFKNNPVIYYYRDVADADLMKDIETSNYSRKNFSMIGQYIFKFVPSFSYEFKFE